MGNACYDNMQCTIKYSECISEICKCTGKYRRFKTENKCVEGIANYFKWIFYLFNKLLLFNTLNSNILIQVFQEISNSYL